MRKVLIHWIWFAELPGLSLQEKAALLRRFSDPEDLFYAGKPELERMEALDPKTVQALINKDLTTSQSIADQCKEKNIGILTYKDAGYPSRLRNLEDAPVLLYYRGCLPDFERQPVISLVGTRKATSYGVRMAGLMSAQLSVCGALVISGGAVGVDAAAMEAALETDSPTVGVLGCGVDVNYPAKNRGLFEKVLKNGCLLSEYPPQTRPDAWHFPQRNRILSGISNGVLVVEAPRDSGALITARCALEQGRDVFVVPGNVDTESCAGSNALMLDGGQPVMCGWDVLREYEQQYPNVVSKQELTKPVLEPPDPQPTPMKQAAADKKCIDKPAILTYSGVEEKLSALSPEEQRIFSCLRSEPMLVDEVVAIAQLPAAKVMSIMTVLSLKGLIQHHPGRRVSAKNE